MLLNPVLLNVLELLRHVLLRDLLIDLISSFQGLGLFLHLERPLVLHDHRIASALSIVCCDEALLII